MGLIGISGSPINHFWIFLTQAWEMMVTRVMAAAKRSVTRENNEKTFKNVKDTYTTPAW